MRMRRLASYILESLSVGRFPMAESAMTDHLYFLDPHERAVFLPSAFHVPSRLRRRIRQAPFRVWRDRDFARTIESCAAPAAGRQATWINRPIREAYLELHRQGFAHSVECWRGDDLQGGLYGVALGGVFFGESMFSHERDASKIALVYLAARLAAGGFSLLDAQFPTDHLMQFGLRILTREEFRRRLVQAAAEKADFYALDENAVPERVLQAIGQTS